MLNIGINTIQKKNLIKENIKNLRDPCVAIQENVIYFLLITIKDSKSLSLTLRIKHSRVRN